MLAVLAMLLIGLGAPPSAWAQSDSVARATLRGWAEGAWLQLLDRRGAVGGRLGDGGILQRFHELIDDKYHLDRLTNAFPLWDDYRWYTRTDGVRWRAGSITKRSLEMDAEFKTTVPLGDAWAFAARYNVEDIPTARRSVIRFGFDRKLGRKWVGNVRVHLDPDKSGTDLEAGVDWRGASGASLFVGVAMLDAMNDFVYRTLHAVNQPQVDSTLDYERQPFTLRTQAQLPLGTRVRAELYGVYMLPATIRAYEGLSETDGMRQHEWFASAGGLIEWSPGRWVRLGAFANTIWARSERERLSPAAPVDEYDLTEQTTELGAFGIVRLARRWTADAWVRHAWRPERRTYRTGGRANVDFLLRSLNGQLLVTYRAASGFTADAGFGLNRARVPRGDGQVPATGSLPATQYRIRYDVGWRMGERFEFLAGAATDIDGDGEAGASFGGARGRFMAFW